MASLLRVAGQRSSLLQRANYSRPLQALALEGYYRPTSNSTTTTTAASSCGRWAELEGMSSCSSTKAVRTISTSVMAMIMENTRGTELPVCWQTSTRRCFSEGAGGTTTTGGGNDGTEGTSSPVVESDGSDDNKLDESSSDAEEIMSSFGDTSYFDHDPLSLPDFSSMSDDELQDTSTIPGWEMIHSPPTKGKVPKGALVGTVVSTKMQKTVNVAVNRYKIARIYRKRMRYTRKFMAHDDQEVAKDGDLVMIVPCHRISKHKHFMLREIIKPKGQL